MWIILLTIILTVGKSQWIILLILGFHYIILLHCEVWVLYNIFLQLTMKKKLYVWPRINFLHLYIEYTVAGVNVAQCVLF